MRERETDRERRRHEDWENFSLLERNLQRKRKGQREREREKEKERGRQR